MGSGHGERAGRVVAAPTGAFQVDFGPGVEIAVFLQRGVAFVSADETGGQSDGAAGGAEKHGQVAAGACAVAQRGFGGLRRADLADHVTRGGEHDQPFLVRLEAMTNRYFDRWDKALARRRDA